MKVIRNLGIKWKRKWKNEAKDWRDYRLICIRTKEKLKDADEDWKEMKENQIEAGQKPQKTVAVYLIKKYNRNIMLELFEIQ